MDASTLSTAMAGALPLSRYQALVGPMNNGMIAAGCNTVNRAAMWCAQVGHESGGLRWMEELASGAAYNNRPDLGNTHPGDGQRYKGRGPIQLTGRYNYGKFGVWAASRGYVSDPNTFVNNPTMLSQPYWGFLAASYYWVVARNMNSYADRGDIVGATKAVNGGTNGLGDRTFRWNHCRPLGARLLPTPQEVPDLDANQAGQLANVNSVANNLFAKYILLDRDLRSDLKDKKDALARQETLLQQVLAAQRDTNALLQQIASKP